MVFLKKANTEDAEKEWLFVREMPEDENGLINSYHGVSRDVFLNRALPEMLAFAEGTGLPAPSSGSSRGPRELQRWHSC